MDEEYLRMRIATAAEQHIPRSVDVAEDISRGRAGLRRRRGVATLGGAALVAVLAFGGAGTLSTLPGGASPESSVPVAGGDAPADLRAPQAAGDPPEGPGGESFDKQGKRDGDVIDEELRSTAEYRRTLFEIVAEHVDPSKKHLDYSNNGTSWGDGLNGERSIGIQMQWHAPGDPGLGMVTIEMSDFKGKQRLRCGIHVDGPCRTVTLASGETVTMAQGADGSYDVTYRRADGVSVQVVVKPLFGGSSTQPVKEVDIDRRDVFRLVQDDRLTLETKSGQEAP
jgi:hypothetical protein